MNPITTLLPVAALAATLAVQAQDPAPPQPTAQPAQQTAPAAAPATPAQQPAPAAAPAADPNAAAQTRERIELTRDALEKWVETRRTIGVERRDWALGKDLLDSRIDVLDRELKTLADRTKEVEATLTEADRKRDALAQEAGTLKDASAQLAAMAAQLEAKVKGLVKRFPTPLAEKLKPLTQRLPEDPATTALPLAVRFQNIVGIINEANRFNREITQSSEIRKLADGSSVEVTAVYLGLAQGYYVGAGGRIAGIGRGAPEGWTWTESNDNGPAIERIVAILRNQKPAAFVPIPVKTN
ncbi:MAG: hypothetical protein RLZZ246_113 [Planctomycetota bacterium]